MLSSFVEILVDRPLRRLIGAMEESKRQILHFMAHLFWRRRKAVFGIIFLNLLAAVFEGSTLGMLALSLEVLTSGQVISLATEYGVPGAVIDGLAAGLTKQTLFVALVVLAVVSQLLRSGSQFGAELATAGLVSNTEGHVRRRLFGQFMEMSYAQVRREKVGDLASYNEQVTYLGSLIVALSDLVIQLFLVLAYAFVLLWLSVPMTAISMGLAVLVSLSLRTVMRRIRRQANHFTKASVLLNSQVIEFLQGLREVRTFAREDYAISTVGQTIDSAVRTRGSVLRWQAVPAAYIDVMTVVGLAALLLGGYFLTGGADVGVLARLATFLLVLFRLMPRASIINKLWGRVVSYLPYVIRISRVLRRDNKEYVQDGQRVFVGLEQGIAFQDVWLRYNDEDAWAVQNLNFKVRSGGMVAIVGESGAGKSTTIDLLLRLYDPTLGKILIDGQDLRQLDLRSWRSQLGVVSQDTFIFHATIRENIAFGKLEATEQEIIEAAKAANAHEFIMEMANGYDTVVGDRGYRMSGGQRQRIAIARAVLRNPDILILDEATSDLDSQSERLIQDALDRMRSHRTVVVIAHRLSTIRQADIILVLKQGRLVEQGTHEELLRRQGGYARFWSLQSGERVPSADEIILE